MTEMENQVNSTTETVVETTAPKLPSLRDDPIYEKGRAMIMWIAVGVIVFSVLSLGVGGNWGTVVVQSAWAIALGFGVRWVRFLFLVAFPIGAVISFVLMVLFALVEGGAVVAIMSAMLLAYSVVAFLLLLRSKNIAYYIEMRVKRAELLSGNE